MIEVTFADIMEKQASRDWIIGVPESEAQYVAKQPDPKFLDVYARDATPEEKAERSDPGYLSKILEKSQ